MTGHVGAALFDMDGTLVDREPLAARAVAATCAARGWSVAGPELDLMVGRAWQDVHRELKVHDHLGWTEAQFVAAVVAMADELVASGYELPALPGVVELIGALHDRGVPLAVVTGSTRTEVESSLGPLGLLESFALVVSAEDYRIGKPAPNPYLAAISRLRVRPERSVAFEDSAAGVAAARAAGLRVVGTASADPGPAHPAHQDLSEADYVVATLADERLLAWVWDVLTE